MRARVEFMCSLCNLCVRFPQVQHVKNIGVWVKKELHAEGVNTEQYSIVLLLCIIESYNE